MSSIEGDRAGGSLERVGDSLLLLTAFLGLGSFMIGHGLVAPQAVALSSLTRGAPAHWAPAVALLLLPCLRRPFRKVLRGRVLLEVLFVALQVVPLFFWPIETAAVWFPAALALMQANLLLQPRQLFVVAWSLALAPAQVLAAMAAAPHSLWLGYFPTTLVVAAAALVFLSARANSERVERGTARAYLRAWSRSPAQESGTRDLLGRLASALSVALTLGLVVVVSYPLLVALPRPAFDPRSTALGAAGSESDAESAAAQRQEDSREQGLERFPGDLRPGGGLGELDYETVMTVGAFEPERLDVPPLDVGPLYLRALCLDTFTRTGLRSNPRGQLRSVRDADDGLEDGWTQLDPRGGSVELLLQVRQNALRVPPTNEIVLFAAQPLRAVRLAEARYDPDRLLALPAGVDVAEFEYELRVGRQALQISELTGRPARHPDGRFTQLPPRTAELDWITHRAQVLMAGAGDDLDRVARVLRHFHQDFGYSTKTSDVPGLEGIVNFMRREQGHCTSFAAAATLLLRTQGIPARVATGFLADDVSPETGRYIVTRSNGHAWIEVHFEGLGWQTFEATPSARRLAALRAAQAGEDDGLATWFAELQGDLGAWARSGADEAYLGPISETLTDAPRATRASLGRRPWLLAFLLVPLALALRVRRRRKLATAARGGRSLRTHEDLLQGVLRTLAQRGHSRPRHLSLREFTRALSIEESDTDQSSGLHNELLAIAALFERATFGARELEPQEIERVRDWTRRFRASGTGS